MSEPMTPTLQHGWRSMAGRGVVSVLFGVAALFWADLTIDVLVVLFGACAIADGTLSLVAASRRSSPARGWLTVAGIAGIALGVVTFAWPSITALALAVIIGAWFTITGIGQVATAIRTPPGTAGRATLAVAGVLGTAFGLYLIAFPRRGAVALVTAIGLVALVRGITMIVTAVTARREAVDVAAPLPEPAVR